MHAYIEFIEVLHWILVSYRGSMFIQGVGPGCACDLFRVYFQGLGFQKALGLKSNRV